MVGYFSKPIDNQQERIAFFPNYSFKKPKVAETASVATKSEGEAKKNEGSRLGTSISGTIGGLITLGIAFLVGLVLKKKTLTA